MATQKMAPQAIFLTPAKKLIIKDLKFAPPQRRARAAAPLSP
jgi:hypothetical protein